MTDALIKRLLDWAPGTTAVRKDCLEAAKTIQSLAAQNARLQAEIAAVQNLLFERDCAIKHRNAEIEALRFTRWTNAATGVFVGFLAGFIAAAIIISGV